MKRLAALAALALLCSACAAPAVPGPSVILPSKALSSVAPGAAPGEAAPPASAYPVPGQFSHDAEDSPAPQPTVAPVVHHIPAVARGVNPSAVAQAEASPSNPTTADPTLTPPTPTPTLIPPTPTPTEVPPTPTPVGPAIQPAPWALVPNWHSSRHAPEVDARAVLVMDEASGAVLYERNARIPLPPASLTKIATSVVALEQGNLDDWVTVDVDSYKMNGSSLMGLRPGDRFTLRDLLFGIMLPSGNDASIAVGRHISGSEAAFVAEMNALVARLGLESANFANTHGLTAPGHVISAYDMALLSRYAMSVDGFYPLSARKYHLADGSKKIDLWNKNGLLYDVPGVDGMKVGYTRAAGRTLVASATRNGNRVYVVLFNAENPREDGAALLEWAFRNHTWQ